MIMSDEKQPTAEAPVIPFSRFRAGIARARTKPVAVALLDRPDVERYVPTLPVQELFYAIKEIGLADATDLIQLVTPEQMQGFFDLDTWQKDRFVPEKAMPWFDILVDAGPRQIARVVDGIDPEVVALYLG